MEVASKKLEDLSELGFLAETNERLKNIIIASLTQEYDEETINNKINDKYEAIIKEINENSNIQIIIKDKTEQDLLELLDELILEHKEQSNLKKIESLEQKLINNLDEGSYSELVKLKNQINRD